MQVAVTAVVVVVLAVVLTVWRHNGSTYLTGFWDNGSQTLVFGRMLQMQQNQTSPGGFMGVYTQDWSDEQNRYWYRDNTPVSPQDFQAYTHQTGLQGWAFGVLNKVLSVFEDRGEAREIILYNINSMLFYVATLLVCLAVWRAWGPLSALAWLCAVVFAPWPQRGMKDLYWCLWTWLLPALAGLLLCAVTQRRCHAAHSSKAGAYHAAQPGAAVPAGPTVDKRGFAQDQKGGNKLTCTTISFR